MAGATEPVLYDSIPATWTYEPQVTTEAASEQRWWQVFGVMPMLFATGPGANSRKALGAAVVFGMAMNAFIGTLFVPNFWALMQTLNEKITARVHPKKS